MRSKIVVLMVSLVLVPLSAWAITLEVLDLYRAVRVQGQLLTNAVATGNGTWVDVGGIKNFSIQVSGITTATVEIDGSNALTAPSDATHGIKLNATDITSDQTVQVNMVIRWVKARVTAYTSGTINAYLQAQP